VTWRDPLYRGKSKRKTLPDGGAANRVTGNLLVSSAHLAWRRQLSDPCHQIAKNTANLKTRAHLRHQNDRLPAAFAKNTRENRAFLVLGWFVSRADASGGAIGRRSRAATIRQIAPKIPKTGMQLQQMTPCEPNTYSILMVICPDRIREPDVSPLLTGSLEGCAFPLVKRSPKAFRVPHAPIVALRLSSRAGRTAPWRGTW